MSITIEELNKLKDSGKIKGFSQSGPVKTKTIKKQRRGDQKDWIQMQLENWCRNNKEALEAEFKFHSVRKWRFDWALPGIKLAIEYEGIMSAKSRHTTISGFTGDIEKYNAAQIAGWTVLRYTTLNYKNMIKDLENAYTSVLR